MFLQFAFRSFVGLAGILVSLLMVFVAPTSHAADFTASWRAIGTASPPGFRAWTGMTWAAPMGRIVLWGGWGATFQNDLHTFDPLTLSWQQVQPHSICPGNDSFATPNGSDENGVAYDPINNSLWIYNGGSGYRCFMTTSYLRTAGAGTTGRAIVDPTLSATEIDHYKDFLVWDQQGYAVVLGYDPAAKILNLNRSMNLAAGSQYSLFADAGGGTWSYDFGTGEYQKLDARHWGYSGSVPSGYRLSPGFAGNGSTYAILFGGAGQYDYTYWAWDNSTWKLDFASQSYQLMLPMGASGPSARGQINNQFVYDSWNNKFILFGGRCYNSSPCSAQGSRLNDTWVYDPVANTWTELHPATKPPARDQGQMFFDSIRGVVVLFGGVDSSSNTLSDLWTLDLASGNWQKITTTDAPLVPLFNTPVAFAPSTGCAYLLYGNTTGYANSYQTYELCLVGGDPRPNADLTVTPPSGPVGTNFAFSGAGSSVSSGSIVAYTWNFGDGTTASGVTANKVYMSPGTFAVSLKVTDSQGRVGTQTKSIMVTAANQPPVAGIALSPSIGSVGTTFNLVGGASRDPDGTIVSYAWNLGDGTTATGATVSKVYATPGNYLITLTVTDNAGAVGTATATVSVLPPGTSSINVASAASGAVATASSTYSSAFSPAGVIDGDRKGLNWASNGGWNDATPDVFPEWVQVSFSGTKTISEVDVFTVQDAYWAPADPTPTMTFSLYGLQSFEIQYWNGANWVTIPGASVTGNNLVWRQFTFAPITTDRIRVWITASAGSFSRITEIEAWTISGTSSNVAPTVSLTAPAANSSFTAPASIALSATASDGDGTVQRVEFFAGGTKIGEATSPPYGITWAGVAAGSYVLTARATDNAGASTDSAPVSVTVNAVSGNPAINVASAANGAVATASSTYSGAFGTAGVLNGDRKGLNWASAGGWNDATPGVFPDWVQVSFSGTKTISEVDVFTVQDTYAAPAEPTPTMTFSLYGLLSFEIQYWDGANWIAIPGASVTGNTLVWRKFTFAPVTTDRIRVWITASAGSYSRITEIEAWNR